MHPINGLQLDEWANEHHQDTIARAQRDLRAQSVARNSASSKTGWLRSGANALLHGLARLRNETDAAESQLRQT